jgi:hypothetical protein
MKDPRIESEESEGDHYHSAGNVATEDDVEQDERKCVGDDGRESCGEFTETEQLV